tara:strand:+ start:313 stop:516 length:204 start_codon:yes stop_codon:yes gene_type:complete
MQISYYKAMDFFDLSFIFVLLKTYYSHLHYLFLLVLLDRQQKNILVAAITKLKQKTSMELLAITIKQ